ncbi:MAG TPA: VIT family protein [Sphingomicrobium sp.]|nr:VIT family protein [Sphingomicrobium sp.]
MTASPSVSEPIPTESGRILSKLNWLRAGVLGANDGIVSTAAIIFGIAGASASHSTIMLAGIAAVAAGALSMAAGEYVSVATQRDLEVAELARQQADLERDPDGELRLLARLFEQRGVEARLASEVARQMSAKDALAVHARAELGLDPDAVTNPWAASFASLVAFTIGGLIPIAAMLMSPREVEIWITGAAVVVAMALTGAVSARLGRLPLAASVFRNVAGGLLAMAITYGVGRIAGTRI